MYNADCIHVVNQIRSSHIEAALAERQIVIHERVIRLGSSCIEHRGSIVKVSAAGDRSAEATATQVDPDKIEPIEDLSFGGRCAGHDSSESLAN